jgi:hypothetical protein
VPSPRLAFSFSLVLLAALAAGSQYSDALEALESGDATRATRGMKALLPDIGDDPVLERALRRYLRETNPATTEALRKALALRSGPTDASASADKLRAAAQSIKSGQGYRDAGLRKSSNWFSRLMERFQSKPDPNPNRTDLALPPGLGGWVVRLVEVLLFVGLAAFILFAISHFRWRRRLRRTASTLLDDDEPLRSPDEWLAQADALGAEGRFREAIRCLYLACLLRADEHGIARFRRHETNWEHLARIESSPKLPQGVDFRRATGQFDRIWYGHHVRGREDFDEFRAWYQQLTQTLAAVPA